MKRKTLHRLALLLAILSILLCLPAVAAQTNFIPPLGYAFVPLAIAADLLWCAAFCFLSKARGYHPFWGLLLLFPPMIFIYVQLFPDKRKSESDDLSPDANLHEEIEVTSVGKDAGQKPE